MVEVLAAPDIEGMVVQFLNAQYALRGDTARAATEYHERPRTVRVGRVGGARKNVAVDAPMVLVECWADDGVEASGLGLLTRALVWSMPRHKFATATIYRVYETGGLQSFPDPSTAQPRYQFIATIECRIKPI